MISRDKNARKMYIHIGFFMLTYKLKEVNFPEHCRLFVNLHLKGFINLLLRL